MASEGQSLVGNMIVPIDLLPPILDDLVRFGRVDQPPRPWLGLFATDSVIGWEAGARPVSSRAEANPTVVNNAETIAKVLTPATCASQNPTIKLNTRSKTVNSSIPRREPSS
jgi:hypothetical protein